MARRKLRETSARAVQILQYLEDHGARRPPGFRISQPDFAAALGIRDPRQLRPYLQMFEEYGVISVRRTTVDGKMGSPRGFNFYLLKCTTKRYVDELGPAFEARRAEKIHLRESALAKNRQAERVRLERGSRDSAVRAQQKAAPRPPLDEATISVLAESYADVPDEVLKGW